VLAIALAALTHTSAFAQQAANGNAATVATANEPDGDEAADVAKQLSNPIANLVSIPFQFNWQNHIAPFDSTRFLLNFQPVVPFTLNDDWNLIARFILPFVGQPAMSVGGIPQSGTSDITFSLFVSPAKSKLIWGVGPAFGSRPHAPLARCQRRIGGRRNGPVGSDLSSREEPARFPTRR